MVDAGEDELVPVLRAALDQTRSAACITTAELDWPGPEIVYVNPAYCKMTGREATEVIGQTPRIMQGPLTSREVLDRLRTDLEAGRPFVGEAVNYRKDGSPYLISWRIDPVLAPDGCVTHYIATQDDVTKLRRAERLLAAEQAIDRAVSTVLSEPGETRDNLGLLGASIVAATNELVGYGRVSLHGSIRLGTTTVPFAVGPTPPVGVDFVDRVSRRIQTGDLGDRSWVGSSIDNERTGIDGILIVSGLDRDELDFVDREGLERLAECTTRALDRVAEYERQRLVAIELQRGLLPTAPATVVGLDITALYRPGAFGTRIGGDWYDVFSDDDMAVLVVGDMAGSGVRAAADMGRLRLLTRVMLQQGVAVPDLFFQLNQFCSDEDLVATALAVKVELDGGNAAARTLRITSAGHPPPLRKAGESVELLTVNPGPLLGIGGDPLYWEQAFELALGDLIVLFTDGLVERSDESIDVSLERLADKVARSSPDGESIRSLCTWLVDERLRESPTDDVAVLGFELADSAVSRAL